MKQLTLFSMLICFQISASAQLDSLICNVHDAIGVLSQNASSSSYKPLFTNNNDTLYLVKSFIPTNNNDTVYSGYLNFANNTNIYITTVAELYYPDNISWLSVDSLVNSSDSLVLYFSNQSFIKKPDWYYFNAILSYTFSDNQLKIITISKNENYIPLIDKDIVTNQEEVLSNFQRISSFLLRRQKEYLVECNN